MEKKKEILESILSDLDNKKMAKDAKELIAEKSETILECVHNGLFNLHDDIDIFRFILDCLCIVLLYI